MKPNKSGFKTYFSAIFGFILLIVVWLNFMPVQFGGQAIYLIIDGISMEPFFYTGDLVILRQSNAYKIGDVAAYYEPFNGGIVIHRIIGRVGDRFVLLGDNKPYPDGYKPGLSDMVGRYWFHLPTVGKIISQFRPQNDSLFSKVLFIGLGFLMIIPMVSHKKRQRHGRKTEKEQPPMIQINKKELAFFLTILMLVSLALAYLAFGRPLSGTTNLDVSYEQRGTFNYSASAPPGIYNSDVVQTGEPIFRALIDEVTINFDYEFSSILLSDVTGTYRIIAKISHSNGWNSTIELLPPTPFDDKSFKTSTVVHMSQVQAVLDYLEQQTGLRSQQYQLVIMPIVSTTGNINGQPLQDEFSPQLVFDLDEIQMKLADTGSAGFNTTPVNPLKPVQKKQVTIQRQAANTLSFLGLVLNVSLVRQLALGGVIISLSGLLVLGWFAFQANQRGEAAEIEFKYGPLLLSVQDSGLTKTTGMVDIAIIDDLVRLAERDGRMILHYTNESGHHYIVNDGDIVYHYQAKEAEHNRAGIRSRFSEKVFLQ